MNKNGNSKRNFQTAGNLWRHHVAFMIDKIAFQYLGGSSKLKQGLQLWIEDTLIPFKVQ